MKLRRWMSLLLTAVLILGLFCGVVPEVSAASEMTASKACIELIKELEGFSKYPFFDNGQWSVGYGTSCPAEDQARYEQNGITRAEAEELMQEQVAGFEARLNKFISDNDLKVSQQQFDALLSFTYNLGSGWMSSESLFRTAVLEGYTGNDFLGAISRWCTASGEILVGLVERRLAEANLYLNGVYRKTPPSKYRYVIYDANLEGVVPDVLVQGYDAEATDILRSSVSKSGYVFLGWYTQSCGGQKITKLDGNISATTLYAHWKTESGELINDRVEDSIATGLVTTDKLNVRSGPGTDYEVVGSLYRGDRVFITEFKIAGNLKWGKVSRGWICMDYVTEDDGTTQLPPEEDGTDAEEKEPVMATGTVVNCSALRVRSGPGTKYSHVDSLPSGTVVEIYETTTVNGTVWGRISTGWICVTNYVKLNSTDNANGGTDSDDSAADDDTAEDNTNTGSDNSNNSDADNSKITGVVTASSLNIRAGAGTGYAKVGSLDKGAKVVILETAAVGSATWGRIDKGWIHMGYVKLDSNSGAGSSGSGSSNSGSSSSGSTDSGSTADVATGTVSGTDWLRVRSGPGTNYSQVDSLARGTRVKILEVTKVGSTSWGKISQGWICLSYVQMDQSDSTASSGSGTYKTVTATSLNIRSGPGTNYSKVGSYSKGNRVQILETKTVKGVAWGKTDAGWICLNYVS